MDFYKVPIVCFGCLLVSFIFLIASKPLPPEKWGDAAYSKSKFANWLNKTKLFENKYVDKYRLMAVYINAIIFVLSLIVLIIDLISGFAISIKLGEDGLIIIYAAVCLWTLLSEATIIFWYIISEK